VDDLDPLIREAFDLLFREVDAMVCNEMGSEKTKGIEVMDGAFAISLSDLLHLRPGLCQVKDQGDMIPQGKIVGGLQKFRAAGKQGMGLHGNGYKGIALPCLDQGFGVLKPLFDRAVIGGVKIIEHFSHQTPYSRLL
jgi:hypothetical protein